MLHVHPPQLLPHKQRHSPSHLFGNSCQRYLNVSPAFQNYPVVRLKKRLSHGQRLIVVLQGVLIPSQIVVRQTHTAERQSSVCVVPLEKALAHSQSVLLVFQRQIVRT